MFSQKEGHDHKHPLGRSHGYECGFVYRCVLGAEHGRADDASQVLSHEAETEAESPSRCCCAVCGCPHGDQEARCEGAKGEEVGEEVADMDLVHEVKHGEKNPGDEGYEECCDCYPGSLLEAVRDPCCCQLDGCGSEIRSDSVEISL